MKFMKSLTWVGAGYLTDVKLNKRGRLEAYLTPRVYTCVAGLLGGQPACHGAAPVAVCVLWLRIPFSFAPRPSPSPLYPFLVSDSERAKCELVRCCFLFVKTSYMQRTAWVVYCTKMCCLIWSFLNTFVSEACYVHLELKSLNKIYMHVNYILWAI